MAHIFKLVGKTYTTGATGKNYTLKSDFEFISEPFTDPKECDKQLTMKRNEYLQSRNLQPSEIALEVGYKGFSYNGQLELEGQRRVLKATLVITAPDDNYAEERVKLGELLFQEF